MRDAAEKAFPNELLSRAEITRRFALAGIEATKRLTEEAAKRWSAQALTAQELNSPSRDWADRHY